MDEENEVRGISLGPELTGLRRFAMVTATLLLVYSFGYGQLADDAQSSVASFIVLHRPGFLLFLLIAASVYATWRYWYYAVWSSLTRARVRKYMRQPKSMLVYKGTSENYRGVISNLTDYHAHRHLLLEEGCPPGLTPFQFILFTDAITAPTQGYMKRLVANRADAYYPRIAPEEIALVDQGDYADAHVDELQFGTRFRTVLEDLDLHAPLVLNGAGVIALTFYLAA